MAVTSAAADCADLAVGRYAGFNLGPLRTGMALDIRRDWRVVTALLVGPLHNDQRDPFQGLRFRAEEWT